MREKESWRRYCAAPREAIEGNEVKLLRGGEEAFPAMIAAIEGARSYVLMEFYAFSDDSAGRAFFSLLAEKARAGVKVFLVYDSIGSILTARDFFVDLAASGVAVAEFRPVIYWKPYWNWIKRDHRKTVCVDGRFAFVGGFNITESDAPRSMGGRGWKDTQVRVSGPAAGEIEKIFWEAWEASTPVSGPKKGSLPPGEYRIAGEKRVLPVSANGIRNVRSIRRTYSHAIDQAREYIYITNAYFLPDRTVLRRLLEAARRGVDVRIIGPRDTDHPYVRWASWSIFGRLLRGGVKVYEWLGPILHSKTAVIDGAWSSVGSHNLDHRSLHYNMELNINVYDTGFGAVMARAFRQDLGSCRAVTLADVKGRPLMAKAASKLLYSLRYLAVFLLALCLCSAAPAAAQEVGAASAQQQELSEITNRLATSLFFRGEVADKIIEAGEAERFIDTSGMETYADLRLAMLGWIKRNPDKAAEVYLGLKGGGRLHTSIESRQTVWEFNTGFLDSVKALNLAAGSASVSREAMEMAARRLYGSGQALPDAPVVMGGGVGGGTVDSSDPGFAGFRLNKAGLETELARASDWLEAIKPSVRSGRASRAYSSAFSVYREFVVAASDLKGRSAVTGRETERLENLRSRLRALLAALALYSRSDTLDEAARPLRGLGERPGAGDMLSALESLRAELDSAAGEAGSKDLLALGRRVNRFEERFARLYLEYTVYDGLLNLRKSASGRGYSCLLDYAAHRFLSAYFPGSGYARASAALAAAAAPLDEALVMAGSGDPAAALEAVDVKKLQQAAAAVREVSRHNRAAQFFNWGILFRPVELRTEVSSGHARFFPAVTIFDVAVEK